MKYRILIFISLIHFVPSAMAFTPITNELIVKEKPWVDVKAYGAVGDNITNDAAAIQAAIDAVATVGGGTVLFPKGTYFIGATPLTISHSQSNVRLLGVGFPGVLRASDSTDVLSKNVSTIRYAGTSSALIIGEVSKKEYLAGICVENIRFHVAKNTKKAIVLNTPSYGYFRNVSVFGNVGLSNYGIVVNGALNYLFEMVEIFGGATGNPTEYLGNGIFLTGGGVSNWAGTTVTVIKGYFHYCTIGANNYYGYANFIDTVFEANDKGYYAYNGHSNFLNPWFEANRSYDIYLGSITQRTNIDGGHFNSYGRVHHIWHSKGIPFVLNISNSYFVSSAKYPDIFNKNAGPLNGKVTLSNITFGGPGKANYKIFGDGTSKNYVAGYDKVRFTNMQVKSYKFIFDNVQAGKVYDQTGYVPAVPTLIHYTMPESGNIIGVNVMYSKTIKTGTYNIAVKVNGADAVNYSFLAIGKQSSEVMYKGDYLGTRISAGDKVTVSLRTDESFTDAGGTILYEVLIAHGEDGKE